MGRFYERSIFTMGSINLKKNDSVLLYSKISGLDSLCLVGVLCLLDTQRQHNTFISSLLTSRQKIIIILSKEDNYRTIVTVYRMIT